MSTVEEICEKAKALPAPLQREALEFVKFLATHSAMPRPDSAEFTSELMLAFAEAKNAVVTRR